jgi:hypothetical protein
MAPIYTQQQRTNNIHAVIFPSARRGGRRNGNAALLFLRHPIHGRPALVHFTNLVRFAGIVQDALRRRRLAGVNVRHDSNVAIEFQVDFAQLGRRRERNVKVGGGGRSFRQGQGWLNTTNISRCTTSKRVRHEKASKGPENPEKTLAITMTTTYPR